MKNSYIIPPYLPKGSTTSYVQGLFEYGTSSQYGESSYDTSSIDNFDVDITIHKKHKKKKKRKK